MNFQSGNVALSMTLSLQKIIVFDKICCAEMDSAAESKLFFHFTDGRQMRSPAILEAESETESWLPWQLMYP